MYFLWGVCIVVIGNVLLTAVVIQRLISPYIRQRNWLRASLGIIAAIAVLLFIGWGALSILSRPFALAASLAITLPPLPRSIRHVISILFYAVGCVLMMASPPVHIILDTERTHIALALWLAASHCMIALYDKKWIIAAAMCNAISVYVAVLHIDFLFIIALFTTMERMILLVFTPPHFILAEDCSAFIILVFIASPSTLSLFPILAQFLFGIAFYITLPSSIQTRGVEFFPVVEIPRKRSASLTERGGLASLVPLPDATARNSLKQQEQLRTSRSKSALPPLAPQPSSSSSSSSSEEEGKKKEEEEISLATPRKTSSSTPSLPIYNK